MGKEVIKASGMSCQHCVMRVTKGLKSLQGVGDVSVNLPTGEITVDVEEGKVSRAELEDAVAKSGYQVVK